MPSIQISINVSAGKAKIERLMKALEPRTLLDAIGIQLLTYVDDSFRTRGRGAWAPLAPVTLMLRRRGGDAPLQDTGRYKGAFVSETGGPGRDYKTDGMTYVEVGSNLKTPDGQHSLAKIHEYGATIRIKRARVLGTYSEKLGRFVAFGKQVTIPARPVMPSKAVAERLIQDTIDGMLSRISAPGTARFDTGEPAVFRRMGRFGRST